MTSAGEAPRDSAVSGEREGKWSLGLLVVHGIGEQRPGDTLEQSAGPIIEVLEDLVGRQQPPAKLSVRDLELEPDDGPPRMTLAVPGAETGRSESHWVIAEARWADSFKPPAFMRMLGWSTIFAWRVLTRLLRSRWRRAQLALGSDDVVKTAYRFVKLENPHASGDDLVSLVAERIEHLETGEQVIWSDPSRLRALVEEEEANFERSMREDRVFRFSVTYLKRFSGTPQRIGIWVASFFLTVIAGFRILLVPVIGLVLLPFALAILLIVAVLSLIPGISSPVTPLRSALERTVGDAFVFTRRRVSSEAMLHAVRDTMLWMEKRCDKLMVVAHSQGSVIVEAIYSDSQPRVAMDKVVVYGSAIGLLRAPSAEWSQWDGWTNYRTTHDPIASLPIQELLIDGSPDPRDQIVRSWGMLTRDHTAYWTNKEGFVLPVVASAAEVQDNESELARRAEEFVPAVADNQRKLQATKTARWGFVAAFVIMAVGLPDFAKDLGVDLLDRVDSALGSFLPIGNIGPSLSEDSSPSWLQTLTGLIASSAVVALAVLAGASAWLRRSMDEAWRAAVNNL